VSPLQFAEPVLLVAAGAAFIGLLVAFVVDRARRRRAVARAGGIQLARMVASVSRQRRTTRAVMFALGVSLLIGALARPQTEGESTWRRRGIDVAVVVDLSSSMLARDAYPDRLTAALGAVDRVMAELEGDRVAAVAFAATALHFPLTHDHRAASLLFDGLRPGDLPQGSGLARAIERARCVVRPDLLGDPACARTGGRGGGGGALGTPPGGVPLEELPTDATGIDRARAMVVFTDGETLDRDVAAQVERAVAAGIELYFVGVGTAGGELIPEYDDDGDEIGWKKTEDGAFVTTRLDEATLVRLAELAGGADHYVRIGEGSQGLGALDGLAEQLNRLKKGDLDERVVRIPNEAYHWLLFPAFVLLLIEACASERRHRAGGTR